MAAVFGVLNLGYAIHVGGKASITFWGEASAARLCRCVSAILLAPWEQARG